MVRQAIWTARWPRQAVCVMSLFRHADGGEFLHTRTRFRHDTAVGFLLILSGMF